MLAKKKSVFAVCAITAFIAIGSRAQDATVNAGVPSARQDGLLRFEQESFFDKYIAKRLHLGVSYTHSSADKTSAGDGDYFLGNLNKLTEKDTDGFGIVIQYDICDYFGIMVANDTHLELAAWNHGHDSSDGALILDGITFMCIGQYPFLFEKQQVSLSPYIGLGMTSISTDWSYAAWWHNGWSSPEDYDTYANGSKEFRNNKSRWMVPDNPSPAFTFAIGLSTKYREHFELNVFYRVVDVDDIDTEFRYRSKKGRVQRTGSFPAKFSSFGASIAYIF